jgi:hypothetical protein
MSDSRKRAQSVPGHRAASGMRVVQSWAPGPTLFYISAAPALMGKIRKIDSQGEIGD